MINTDSFWPRAGDVFEFDNGETRLCTSASPFETYDLAGTWTGTELRSSGLHPDTIGGSHHAVEFSQSGCSFTAFPPVRHPKDFDRMGHLVCITRDGWNVT